MTSVIAASSGNFLVQPGAGVMIWTLIAFGITIVLLRKLAYPRIAEALDKRRIAIEESIDHAERTRQEADALLREYRERLKEAREQADDAGARQRRQLTKWRRSPRSTRARCSRSRRRTTSSTRCTSSSASSPTRSTTT